MRAKRFRVVWTAVAIRDAEEILDFVQADSATAAGKLLGRLRKRAETLESFPLRGRRIPELEDLHLPQIRELLEAPYRLIYRVENREVSVLAVLDGRRHLEDLLLRRLLGS